MRLRAGEVPWHAAVRGLLPISAESRPLSPLSKVVVVQRCCCSNTSVSGVRVLGTQQRCPLCSYESVTIFRVPNDLFMEARGTETGTSPHEVIDLCDVDKREAEAKRDWRHLESFLKLLPLWLVSVFSLKDFSSSFPELCKVEQTLRYGHIQLLRELSCHHTIKLLFQSGCISTFPLQSYELHPRHL